MTTPENSSSSGEKKNRLGILGGGQLALMLAQAAKKLGLIPWIYAHSPEEPALMEAENFVIGGKNDLKTLESFCQEVPLVIFESELFEAQPLNSFTARLGVRFLPTLETMQVGGDKLSQKKIFTSLTIPTARFTSFNALDSHESLNDWMEKLYQDFPQGFVLKWAKGGYDGKGTCINPEKEQALEFAHEATSKKVDLYAEACVKFEQELALVSTRSADGEIVFYPVVHTQQKRGVCHVVEGPAKELGLSVQVEDLAQQYAHTLSEHLKLVGSFALEFFLDHEGKLLVNEFAPRVHNSGHFSLNACLTSQFENHCRAAWGLPLGPTQSNGFFGMVNILGPLGFAGAVEAPDFKFPDTHLFWYGKAESRPDRKLGHVNVMAPTPDDLQARLAQVRAELDNWMKQITTKHC